VQRYNRRFVPGGELPRPANHAEPGVSDALEISAFHVADFVIRTGYLQRRARAADDVDQTARFDLYWFSLTLSFDVLELVG